MIQDAPEFERAAIAIPAPAADLCDELTAFGPAPRSCDPLGWPGYAAALARRAADGGSEAVVAGDARIDRHDAVLVAFDPAFMGGSMGEATGARVVAAIEHAMAVRRPLVSVIASGGARMQEGSRSLVQMQRIAGALAAARRAGIPHVAVLRHPTTGGVWASLGAVADVILAERDALVAFAGPRLRDDGAGSTAEAEAFVAAGKRAQGFVDAEVAPDGMRDALSAWVALLTTALATPAAPCDPPAALADGPADPSGWAAVEAARSPARPRAEAYLDAYFEQRLDLHGDRCGGVDDGILIGMGRHDGRAVAYVAQRGTATRPAGFRTALRLLRLAERLRIPVLSLIDTPGAANDARAEADGVGTAIAELLLAVAELEVPMTSAVIGEGGSGGALALAAPGRLWIAPDGYFSVIAPELAAEILHRDRGRAQELSERLALRPSDVVRLGVACGVLTSSRDGG